ncbi:MAG: SET domain-containing protein [Pseudomonadota bacterium]
MSGPLMRAPGLVPAARAPVETRRAGGRHEGGMREAMVRGVQSALQCGDEDGGIMTRASGFQVRHEVRMTPDKGRGVFVTDPVAAGTIVWRFVPGLFEVYDEPGYLALLAPLSHDGIIHELTHAFGLAEFPDCVIRVRCDGVLINHAGDANVATNFAAPRRAWPDGAARGSLQAVRAALPQDRYALIATRAIAAGEELTNNYTDDISEPAFFERLCDRYGVDDSYLEG